MSCFKQHVHEQPVSGTNPQCSFHHLLAFPGNVASSIWGRT